MKVVGLVLAGGRSSRFGREKAAVELAGRPMIAWVVDALAGGCTEVAINAKADTQASLFARNGGFPCLMDDPTDPEGPLAGVRAGLAWAANVGADALATAPCDTPFLPPDMIERLAVAAQGGGAVVRTPQGLEPLCTIWIVAQQAHIAQALAQDRHPPIREVLAKLRAVEVMFPDARAFANLNTEADYLDAVRYGRAEPK